MKKNIAVYPGTFDPITKGHIDVIRRALRLFDKLIIVVARNRRKKTLFDVKERVELIKAVCKDKPQVTVVSHEGLIVDYMGKTDSIVMIRGLRAVSDFEYELQLALTNRSLNSNVETIFLMPDAKNIYLNSSVVRDVAFFGGDLSPFVPSVVAKALKNKVRKS